MMYYLESDRTDPYFNLALEQYVFDELSREHSYFMLWQNHNSIIVGKHQNTVEEINAEYVREQGITVARRLSGGGAVYHDLGNLNYTFITDSREGLPFDFRIFCEPVAKALSSMGVKVEISGRNDMTIDGMKFSGNSQYGKRGRILHHGTLLFDSDLRKMAAALRTPADKIESKGIKSIRSRVTNIKPYLKEDISMRQFLDALREYMFRENNMAVRPLTDEDVLAVEALRDQVYRKWEWNYGASPAYRIRKQRRIEGCGRIEAHLDVAKNGILQNVAFYGDFFGNGDLEELAERIKGQPLEEKSLRHALSGTDIGHYFNNLDLSGLLTVLLS